MRTRNPWRFCRWRFFGWYVRFTTRPPRENLPTIAQRSGPVIVDNLSTTGGPIHNLVGRTPPCPGQLPASGCPSAGPSGDYPMVHLRSCPQGFAHLWVTLKCRIWPSVSRTPVRQEHPHVATNIAALPRRISTITVTTWWPMAFREMRRFVCFRVGHSAGADNSRNRRGGNIHIPPPRGRTWVRW